MIYHLRTIVPRLFYGRRRSLSNQHEMNNNNYSAVGSKCVYLWQGQVTLHGTTVNSCFFFLNLSSQYPSDSKPNTVACSKLEFRFDCQKDTETAMRPMYRVHFGPNRFSLHSYLGSFPLHVCQY